MHVTIHTVCLCEAAAGDACALEVPVRHTLGLALPCLLVVGRSRLCLQLLQRLQLRKFVYVRVCVCVCARYRQAEGIG